MNLLASNVKYVSPIRYNITITTTKEGTMSANVYSVADLLVGTRYASRTLKGTIVNAIEHPFAVFYEGCDSYLVEIQPDYGVSVKYRTVAVKTK
jgi:hypothetical protein